MMQIVSEEESKRWKAEVQRLRASKSAEDRIVAILMDLEIGGSGNSGDPARAKARAICELVNLRDGAWEKLVRTAADQLYALGKQVRIEDSANGQYLQVIATEMHRECQVIKGEDPLPHAGERLTEKPKPDVSQAGEFGPCLVKSYSCFYCGGDHNPNNCPTLNVGPIDLEKPTERRNHEVLDPAAKIGPVNVVGPTLKRKDEPECDCFIPTLEGAGQHSPTCAIFKKRG